MSQFSNSEEHLNDHKLWSQKDPEDMKDSPKVPKLQQNSEENVEMEDSDVEKKDSSVSRKTAPALKKKSLVKASHTRTATKKAGKQNMSTAAKVSQQEQKKKQLRTSQEEIKSGTASQHSSVPMGLYSNSNQQLSSFSTNTMDTIPEDMVSRGKLTGDSVQGDSKAGIGEELCTVSESGKAGNMFELFKASDGEEYTVYLREDGKRFYVDFEEQVQY